MCSDVKTSRPPHRVGPAISGIVIDAFCNSCVISRLCAKPPTDCLNEHRRQKERGESEESVDAGRSTEVQVFEQVKCLPKITFIFILKCCEHMSAWKSPTNFFALFETGGQILSIPPKVVFYQSFFLCCLFCFCSPSSCV